MVLELSVIFVNRLLSNRLKRQLSIQLFGIVEVIAVTTATISVAPPSAQVTAGRGASFHCYGERTDDLYWNDGRGNVIVNGQGRTLEEYTGEYKVLTLRFTSVMKGDEGYYCCSLMSSSCRGGRNVTLSVILPSTGFIAPRIQYIQNGDGRDVFINCSIKAGDPRPTIVWYLAGVGFLDVGGSGVKYQANYSGLLIRQFSEEDTGNYTCEYQENLSGSFSAPIEVRFAENTIAGPRELLVGSDGVLNCLHDNNLQVLSVEWTKPNGDTTNGPTLSIIDAQLADEGSYSCTLHLSDGSLFTELEHKLTVYGEWKSVYHTVTITKLNSSTFHGRVHQLFKLSTSMVSFQFSQHYNNIDTEQYIR